MFETGNTVSASLDRFDERHGRCRIPRPRQEDLVGESMRRFGQLTPLVATEREDVFAIVDGFKRLHAARKLGLKKLEVRVLPLSEQAAVAAVYSLNRYGQGMTDMEEALVVQSLCREHGLAQVEVGTILGRHKSWVSRRLMLIERLSEQVQNDVRVGLVSVSMAREITRLPRGNQPEIAICIHRNGLTVRETSRLVTLFEKATNRTRQQSLLDCPRDALEKHRGGPAMVPYDPRLSTRANQLRRLLLSVLNGTSRLSLEFSNASDFTEAEESVLKPLFQKTRVSALLFCEAFSFLENSNAS